MLESLPKSPSVPRKFCENNFFIWPFLLRVANIFRLILPLFPVLHEWIVNYSAALYSLSKHCQLTGLKTNIDEVFWLHVTSQHVYHVLLDSLFVLYVMIYINKVFQIISLLCSTNVSIFHGCREVIGILPALLQQFGGICRRRVLRRRRASNWWF